MGSFDGKVALVTGASSGMGFAIALAFAEAGAEVVAADINTDGGQQVVKEINDAGGSAVFVRTDVADASDVQAMVSAAVEHFGGLDHAVNAAAIEGESVPLDEIEDDVFDRMMAINTRGIYLSMKHEIKAMLGNGAGTIVNIASTNSYRPQPNQSSYTASKFAVLGLTKSAAIDYAGRGIRINAICPGSIDTPMLRNAMARRNRDVQATIDKLSLIGRFGRVDEIAKAALWLSSEDSSFTVGHALAVDAVYLSR